MVQFKGIDVETYERRQENRRLQRLKLETLRNVENLQDSLLFQLKLKAFDHEKSSIVACDTRELRKTAKREAKRILTDNNDPRQTNDVITQLERVFIGQTKTRSKHLSICELLSIQTPLVNASINAMHQKLLLKSPSTSSLSFPKAQKSPLNRQQLHSNRNEVKALVRSASMKSFDLKSTKPLLFPIADKSKQQQNESLNRTQFQHRPRTSTNVLNCSDFSSSQCEIMISELRKRTIRERSDKIQIQRRRRTHQRQLNTKMMTHLHAHMSRRYVLHFSQLPELDQLEKHVRNRIEQEFGEFNDDLIAWSFFDKENRGVLDIVQFRRAIQALGIQSPSNYDDDNVVLNSKSMKQQQQLQNVTRAMDESTLERDLCLLFSRYDTMGLGCIQQRDFIRLLMGRGTISHIKQRH